MYHQFLEVAFPVPVSGRGIITAVRSLAKEQRNKGVQSLQGKYRHNTFAKLGEGQRSPLPTECFVIAAIIVRGCPHGEISPGGTYQQVTVANCCWQGDPIVFGHTPEEYLEALERFVERFKRIIGQFGA